MFKVVKLVSAGRFFSAGPCLLIAGVAEWLRRSAADRLYTGSNPVPGSNVLAHILSTYPNIHVLSLSLRSSERIRDCGQYRYHYEAYE